MLAIIVALKPIMLVEYAYELIFSIFMYALFLLILCTDPPNFQRADSGESQEHVVCTNPGLLKEREEKFRAKTSTSHQNEDSQHDLQEEDDEANATESVSSIESTPPALKRRGAFNAKLGRMPSSGSDDECEPEEKKQKTETLNETQFEVPNQAQEITVYDSE